MEALREIKFIEQGRKQREIPPEPIIPCFSPTSCSSEAITATVEETPTDPLLQSPPSTRQFRSRLRGKQLAVNSTEKNSLGEGSSDEISSDEPLKKKKKDSRVSHHQSPVDESNSSPSSSERGKRLRPTNRNVNYKETRHLSVSSSSSDEEEFDTSDSEENSRHNQPTTKSTGRKNRNQFKCDISNNCYPCKSTMAQHMNSRSVARPFKCDMCPKTFSVIKSLRRHRKIHFPPTHKCDFCPKMFTSQQSRNLHMNTHTGNKPFECGQCHEKFVDSGNLSRHKQRHHSVEPKFKCEICDKMFFSSSNLWTHRQVHSATKHECPFCKEKFSRSDYCQKHWKGDKNRSIACKVRRSQIV